MDYQNAACKQLGIKAEQVLSLAEYDDHITVVIDYGVEGGKKLMFSKDDLIPVAEIVEDKPKRRGRRKK